MLHGGDGRATAIEADDGATLRPYPPLLRRRTTEPELDDGDTGLPQELTQPVARLVGPDGRDKGGRRAIGRDRGRSQGSAARAFDDHALLDERTAFRREPLHRAGDGVVEQAVAYDDDRAHLSSSCSKWSWSKAAQKAWMATWWAS